MALGRAIHSATWRRLNTVQTHLGGPRSRTLFKEDELKLRCGTIGSKILKGGKAQERGIDLGSKSDPSGIGDDLLQRHIPFWFAESTPVDLCWSDRSMLMALLKKRCRPIRLVSYGVRVDWQELICYVWVPR